MAGLADELRQAMLDVIEQYRLALENSLILPGGAPEHQWKELEDSFREALQWADLMAAERTRKRAIGQRIELPSPRIMEIATPEQARTEVLELNPWVEQHAQRTSPLIEWRAKQTAAVEQNYAMNKAKLAQYAGVPVDKIMGITPAYRLDRFRRDQMGEIAEVSQQVQLAIPIVGEQFPFMTLDSRADSRVRPGHALADGTIAPRTHPIWIVIRPRNGFSCRCTSRLISRRDAMRQGLMSAAGVMILEDVRWGSAGAKRAYEAGVPYHGSSYDQVPRSVGRICFPDPGWMGPKAVAGVSIGAAA